MDTNSFFRTLSLPAFAVILAASIATASGRPPTPDPTYGEPLPRLQAPSKSPSANWIWTDRTVGSQTVYVRGIVMLRSAPRNATLFVTGDDAFVCFVNGRKVDSTEPVEQGWKQMHRERVEALLRPGKNVIAIQGVNSGGAAGILAQLEADGTVLLRSNRSWKALESPVPPPGWVSTAFDDTHWPEATEVAPFGQGPWASAVADWPDLARENWYLVHRSIRPTAITVLVGAVERRGRLSGAIVVRMAAEGAPRQLLVDFGQEYAGRLALRGTPGTRLRITTGETREECFHAEPALDNSGPFTLTLTGTRDGNAPSDASMAGFESAYTPYSAFRYALLTFIGDEEATLADVHLDFKYYPVQYRGAFACSDPMLTRIWYAGAYSAHLCMQEDIWDAPKRDRGLWCGDLQVTGETINNVFADRFLMERSIAGLRTQVQNGRPDADLPASDINTLPGYTAAWFCELADYYRHVGADAFLKSQHARIVSLLDFQRTEFDANNLFVNPLKEWNFVDWAPDFVVDSPHARMATEMYDIAGIREAVFLLRALGDRIAADRYAEWARQLAAAAQRSYLDAATSTFGERLQTNVMAVASGVATPEQRKAIYARILGPDSAVWKSTGPRANLDSYVMTPYYGYFVLRDLGDLGHEQDGINLIRRYWGAMLKRGTATSWEKFDPSAPADVKTLLDQMPYLSLSHGWSTGPTTFLSEYVLGVRPTGPGMTSVRIAPFLGDLSWIEGNVPAPQGLIHVRVETRGQMRVMRLDLPAGIDADVSVPGVNVLLDGHPVASSGNYHDLRFTKAGIYHITSTISIRLPSIR